MQHESRLLEMLGALSLATDRGGGFPPETALRTSIIGSRLARAWGGDDQFVRDSQLACLLRYLGCTGSAHEAAALHAGDDQGFLQLFADVDVGKPLELLSRAPRLAPGAPMRQRVRTLAKLADPRIANAISLGHCEVACRLGAQIGANSEVVRALRQTYERFDGRGLPDRLRGNAVARVARVMHAAQVFEVMLRSGGVAEVRAAVQRRARGQLDPELAQVIEREAGDIANSLVQPSLLGALLADEPAPHACVTADRRREVALAFSLVGDLKSTFTLGHSTRVAELAERCAGPLGVANRDDLRDAALLHDLGRVGISNALWEKPSALTFAERQRIEEHSWLTDQILRASPLLYPLSELTGVHERLDGSGYHRRMRAVSVAPAARLLAACDVYVALVSDRPQRRAHAKGMAAKILGEEARAGRLDRDSVRVVLEVVGQPLPKLRGHAPAALSSREIDVLALLAKGRSNKDIAARLHVAERTVKNHVANVYDKIGVRTRAGAALFAVEHDLIDAGAFEN